jgi:hypothetical protein
MSIDVNASFALRLPIGLRGAARAGKDTLAALLCEQGTHHRRAFADSLKEEVGLVLLNLADSDINRLTARAFIDKIKADPEVRRLLQAYGKVKRDHVSTEYWIYELDAYRRIYEAGPGFRGAEGLWPRIVIPDVRYPNEIDYVHNMAGVCVEVQKGWADGDDLTGEQAVHESETLLRAIPADIVVVNLKGHPEAMLPQLRDGLITLAMRRNADRPVVV